MSIRSLALPVIVVSALCVVSLAQARDPEPETVAGKRYRIVWLGTGEDLAHGGGRWVHEIFLPDRKLVVTVVPEDVEVPGKAGAWPTTVERSRLYVRAADAPRNAFTGIDGHGPSPVEDVRLPAALVAEVVAFAELSRRYEEEGFRLGSASKTQLALPDLPRKDE